jgi:hypothetical protein
MKTTTVSALPIVLVASALLSRNALSQQKPIYGCRQSINCRPSPVSNSALLDPGVSGLLLGGSIQWGPGFHVGFVMPALKIPLVGKEPTYDVKDFHFRNASLLPTPGLADVSPPLPFPTVTPGPR